MELGTQSTKDVKAGSLSDLALQEVRAAAAIANAWVAGDDDIPMDNNDTLLLYLQAAIDGGSPVTEIRFRLSFDPDGTGTFFRETAVDLQPPAAGVMDGDLVDVQYVLPVDAHIVRVEAWGDGVGPDDQLSIHAERMLRDG